VPLQEDAHKVDRQAEDEEKKKMAEAYWMFDGHPRKFREIVSRRKKKKGEAQMLLILRLALFHLLLLNSCSTQRCCLLLTLLGTRNLTVSRSPHHPDVAAIQCHACRL
jgi:hypothetical protein